MVKRTKPRKEPNSSAVQYRNAIIFWRIHLLIMTVAKRWRQTQQFNVHTSQTILWVNLIRSPLLNFITTSLMMKKQAIIDRRPPVFINMICRNSMKYYDNEWYDILYDMMNNTKRRYVMSKILTADCWCSGNSLLALPGELVGCEVSSSIIFVSFIGTCECSPCSLFF